jgi:hypothetical protein
MTRDDLKTRIKELAAEGAAFREKIRRTSGLERHALWNEKRRVGRRARAALMAYAYLRGVPHARMEPRCRPSDLLHAGILTGVWERELGIKVVRYTSRSATRGILAFFGLAAPEPRAPIDSIWTEARVAGWLAARAPQRRAVG